jgi:hypothetical protein
MSKLPEYSLTEVGKAKSDSSGDGGALRYRIINHINEKGSATIPELADSCDHPKDVTRRMVIQLCKEDWLIESGNDFDD